MIVLLEVSLPLGLELQGKWERRAETEARFSAPVASIPDEQMALSGVRGTESLPGWLWPASPRAAVLFPDPGFQAGWLRQAGWAGAWAADRASRGPRRPAAVLEWSREPNHHLTRSVPAGMVALPGPEMTPLSFWLPHLPCEFLVRPGFSSRQCTDHIGSVRSLLGLFKNCSDSYKHSDLWPSGKIQKT